MQQKKIQIATCQQASTVYTIAQCQCKRMNKIQSSVPFWTTGLGGYFYCIPWCTVCMLQECSVGEFSLCASLYFNSHSFLFFHSYCTWCSWLFLFWVSTYKGILTSALSPGRIQSQITSPPIICLPMLLHCCVVNPPLSQLFSWANRD